ncbi:MAG: HD domain-containing protein [Alphaproteobacteria bacterium]|nr:HD domain-containing protein [Alphaproteobacteria bacterium]MBO6864325.1 HD domain-containing protein [Alphaproteobacteria bacterium]
MTVITDTLPTHPDRVTRETAVDFIIELFRHIGDRDYIGEAVSQREHGIQCAVMADQLENRDSLTAAALLHDIGHFLHAYEEDCAEAGIDSRHEDCGADFLARFFPPEVSEPVRLHVDAKRYLCAVEPSYFDRLSPASIRSLELQGGPMQGAELERFAANPHLADAVILRRCDEGAKVPDLQTPSIESYRPMLEGLLKP